MEQNKKKAILVDDPVASFRFVDKYRRNCYTRPPCRQKRSNASHLQPPCDKHGTEENCSAGNAEKSYDDHHKRCKREHQGSG